MPRAKANIIQLTPDEKIIRKIYIIREQKVMLDFDLATLYEVETRRLNEQVKRNIDRFPTDFMFRLTKKEWQTMRSQFATSSPQAADIQTGVEIRSQFATLSPEISIRSQSATLKRGEHSKYLPYAFTEHGVTILASVLKSERAVKMSIAVVRAFIELKRSALQYKDVIEQMQALREQLGEHDVQLNSIYGAIENLLDDKVDKELKEEAWKKRKRIGFKSGE